MIKELICISCPNGCHLKVDTEMGYTVTGNKCEKGAEYGRAEVMHPVRVVTSTVVLRNAAHRRLPVRTDRAVGKERIFEVMDALCSVTVDAPVKTGDVIIENILGTGANVVACKDFERI